MSKERYIVITGGAGFIGSCLIQHLNTLGYKKLIIVDDLGEGEKWKNLVGKQFSEIIHKYRLFEWLEGREQEIEAFFHLGACSSTTEKDANYLLENNYRYSLYLAQYALEYGHRFIYASSAATFGDGSQGFSDSHDILESLRPLNMYGYSKHLFDLWLYRENLLGKVVGLKFFNVFGPNEYHKGEMISAPYKMVGQIKTYGKVKLFESSDPEKFPDGEQIRDFIYVKDAVKMTASFLNHPSNGIFNIGSGKGSTWNQLARAVFKALGRVPAIEYIPMPETLIGKYQNYTCADKKKGEKIKLPLSEFTLEEAISDYVQNYVLSGDYL